MITIQIVLLSVLLVLHPFYNNKKLWVLHAFILLLPNNTWLESSPMITTTDFFVIVMGAIILGDYALGAMNTKSKNDLRKYILLLFLASILSVIFAHYPKRALGHLWIFIKLTVLFYYVQFYILDISALRSTAKVFVLSGIVPAFYGILTRKDTLLSLMEHYKIPLYLRSQGSFAGGTVEFTYYIVIMFGFLLTIYISRKSLKERIFYGSIIGLYLLTLAITFTRNGYLALITCLLTVIWLKSQGKVWGVLIFGIICTGFLLILPIPQLIVSRFLSLFAPTSDPSIMARPMLWMGAIKIFKDNPLFGVGIGNFGMVFRRGYCPVLFRYVLYSSAHNIILNTLADMGIVGIISIILLLWNNGKQLLKVYLNSGQSEINIIVLGLIATGISVLTFGLSDFVWINQRSGTITGLLLGLMAVSVKIFESTNEYPSVNTS